jgi:4-aminobutyrate aminotransferase
MAASLEERERRVIAEIQKIRFFPLAVVGGEGSYLLDERGQRILDLSGTWGAATLGYNHPAVAEAVAQVLGSLASASSVSSTNEQAVALAEELLALVPGSADRRVWFGHCGSDANEAIVRAITRESQRDSARVVWARRSPFAVVPRAGIDLGFRRTRPKRIQSQRGE